MLVSYIYLLLKHLQPKATFSMNISFFCVLDFEVTGLVSSRVNLNSLGEGASTALVGFPSSDGVTIKIPFGVDLCVTLTSLVRRLVLQLVINVHAYHFLAGLYLTFELQ